MIHDERRAKGDHDLVIIIIADCGPGWMPVWWLCTGRGQRTTSYTCRGLSLLVMGKHGAGKKAKKHPRSRSLSFPVKTCLRKPVSVPPSLQEVDEVAEERAPRSSYASSSTTTAPSTTTTSRDGRFPTEHLEVEALYSLEVRGDSSPGGIGQAHTVPPWTKPPGTCLDVKIIRYARLTEVQTSP